MSTPMAQSPVESGSGRQLRVLAGLHEGACVDLRFPGALLVGSATDCDVQLKDEGVLARHALLLLTSADRIELRAIEGAVRLASATLEPGASEAIDGVTMFGLGKACLAAGPAEHAGWSTLDPLSVLPPAAPAEQGTVPPIGVSVPPHEVPDEPADDDLAAAAADTADDDTPSAARTASRLRSRWKKVAAATVAIGALSVFVMIGWQEVSHAAKSKLTQAALADAIAATGASEVHVVEADNGVLRLEGLVITEQQRSALLDLLRQRGLQVAVDIVSGEQLAMSVQNGFRQRAMAVEARYAGQGRVQVSGATATPAVEQIIRDVMAGARAIRQIELTDPPPAAPARESVQQALAATGNDESGALSAAAAQDPRRVVGVVGGEEPFVLTKDGKRYLVGATLPDGSQVQKIVGHTVTFQRNGKPLPVRF
jgi:type III secretion protein D